MSDSNQTEMVTLKVDGQEITVPKGTNLIQAAKEVGVDVPFYCYHKDLSVAGNCRMCQLKVEGRPKLEIGCNTAVADGMEVSTQASSPEVQKAHEATLEFILINHPLDCTVCDQAGHCKLQDYHFDHNAKPSRFIEDKVHKPKAKPLGPTVMLDAERCIMCTRCIRFCDEITETSELGMINRGDRSEITIVEGKELDNPLAGNVVDLCPVGALTHREWRFNTRIWFTDKTETICPGCSTGCSVTVHSRDGEIVTVKGRNNEEVNKEWICDEGRYGFGRFLPKSRIVGSSIAGEATDTDSAAQAVAKLKGKKVALFLAGELILEELDALKSLMGICSEGSKAALAFGARELGRVEKLLVSPDYAANYVGAQFLGLVGDNPQAEYESLLSEVSSGAFEAVVFAGDRSVFRDDQSAGFLAALDSLDLTVGLLADSNSELHAKSKIVIPARSILEKSGLLVNKDKRLQYTVSSSKAPKGVVHEASFINKVCSLAGSKQSQFQSDREATLALIGSEDRLSGLRISDVKAGGVCLKSYTPKSVESAA